MRAVAVATATRRNRGTCGGGCGSRQRRWYTSGGDASRAGHVMPLTRAAATWRPEHMARGLESKSVEAQQEEAQRRRPAGRPVDRQNAARQAERATLALARTRAEADLKGATA